MGIRGAFTRIGQLARSLTAHQDVYELISIRESSLGRDRKHDLPITACRTLALRRIGVHQQLLTLDVLHIL